MALHADIMRKIAVRAGLYFVCTTVLSMSVGKYNIVIKSFSLLAHFDNAEFS